MTVSSVRIVFLLAVVLLLNSCANIVPPAGGPRDITPPKLISVFPKDSSTNTRVTKLELRFDEFVALNNPSSEITVAPLLPFPFTSDYSLKNVVIKIPDSLLQPNTTYRISFGKAIQDIHENNPFKGYQYTFSTGAYFDSLKLGGKVMNAATGKAESNVLVVLYNAKLTDSCVVKQKPIYITKTDPNGSFFFDGLPVMPMKIFALNDANNNLMYDGKDETIAFSDTAVLPNNLSKQNIVLKLFSESDSVNKKKTDASTQRGNSGANKINDKVFSYLVKADTSDFKKRTQEISQPLFIETNKTVAKTNKARMSLWYDSLGTTVEANASLSLDTLRNNRLMVTTPWKENTVYTLKLLKGFAQDSTGADALPSKNSFRTKRKEDYAKLMVHLPTRYRANHFLLQVLRDDESIYLHPVKDTMIVMEMLSPGGYTLRVIDDRNQNGKWDHGLLLLHQQPEEVIPYPDKINLKAGWENMVDFDERKE